MEQGAQMPSEWVLRWAHLILPGTRVLDLACGQGRHARLLASRGALVTALDRDEATLKPLGEVWGVSVLRADVETGPWPFGPETFDAIIVTNYLHRALFPFLAAALRPGGTLIYETFMLGNERHGRPSNPEFLLRPAELLDAWSDTLQVLGFEEGFIAKPKAAVVQRACLAKLMVGEVVPLPQR